jgi:DNA-binding transcriptional LysR family regulator
VQLRNVDLNLLVALDALLAERSVTAAAEAVSVGQPAMSATLGRLRKLFGDPLLVKVGNELQPTPLAEALRRPVREVLDQVQAVLSVRGTFDPATASRTFTVVASDYVGLLLLRPLLRRLVGAAPSVRLSVRPVTTEFTAELRRGQVDLAVVPQDLVPESADLLSEELFTDRYVCAVDRANPDVGDRLSVDELSRYPHLASGGGPLPALGQRELEPLGVPHRAELSTQTSLLAPFFLAGTDLVTVVLERLGRELAEAAGIRLVEPPIPLPTIAETMYWHPRRAEDPGSRWLRGQLREVAREL